MFEEIIPLEPVHFFSIGLSCHYFRGKEKEMGANYKLPNFSDFYLEEERFAEIFLGWNEEGLIVKAEVNQEAENSYYPDFRKGDSFELFIDTRDVKKSGFATKFCHHFLFFPKAPTDEVPLAHEVTRFRGEESHPLADSSLFSIDVVQKRKGYVLKLFIPKEALYGYDPSQFKRMGFSYRVNRFDGDPQYFSVTDADFTIENHPIFWSSMELTGEKK